MMDTQDARRDFAALVEDVLRGEHVELTRYGRPVAVVVPPEWHEQAKALEAMAVEAIESGGFSIGSMEILEERYRAQAEALRQGRRQARLGRRESSEEQ